MHIIPGFGKVNGLKSLLKKRYEQNLKNVRFSRLRYMLIFPLAPVFANMQADVLRGFPDLAGLDPMSAMGIAYCLGAGLLFSFVSLKRLSAYARLLSCVSAALYLGWVLLPVGALSLAAALMFSFTLGGCAGIAAFSYSYALNRPERLLGAALISLYYIVWQLPYSYGWLTDASSHAYLSSLTLGTLICLSSYRTQDYENAREIKERGLSLPLILALLFFFMHKTVEIFYSYLPVASGQGALRANAWGGIFVFFLSLFLYFKVKFSVWHMCNLFFVGMLLTVLPLFVPLTPAGAAASRHAHGFEQIGFIVSYYLLGSVLARRANFRLFKWIIFSTLTLSVLIYMVPGFVMARAPGLLPVLAGTITAGSFLLFILLSPYYWRSLFSNGDGAAEQQESPPEELSQESLLEAGGFTPREREIISLLLEGMMFRECADTLHISVDTVKYHAKNIYRKLNITSRSQLYAAVRQLKP